jgi:hypothetical protein
VLASRGEGELPAPPSDSARSALLCRLAASSFRARSTPGFGEQPNAPPLADKKYRSWLRDEHAEQITV